MAAQHHEGTANVVQVVATLAQHGGYLPTSQVAMRTGIGRDQVRRILWELAEQGWVQRATEEDGDGDRWALGHELPQIGLTWQARLVREAEALRGRFDQLMGPLAPRRS